MANFILCGWEVNGYSDSDWEVAYYDDTDNSIKLKLTGTTRYGMGTGHACIKELDPQPLTKEIVEKARVLLENHIFAAIKEAERRDVDEPDSVEVGTRVRFVEDHKNQEKMQIEEPCYKCGGTGKWVNPRNTMDQRTCFACNGTGMAKRSGGKVKVNGKQSWVKIPMGTEGEVVWTGTFRTIWRNGYNKLGRYTLSTKVKLDDGRVVNAPLSKLGLTKAKMTDAELRARAVELSRGYEFKPMVSRHGGWLDFNAAAKVMASE